MDLVLTSGPRVCSCIPACIYLLVSEHNCHGGTKVSPGRHSLGREHPFGYSVCNKMCFGEKLHRRNDGKFKVQIYEYFTEDKCCAGKYNTTQGI